MYIHVNSQTYAIRHSARRRASARLPADGSRHLRLSLCLRHCEQQTHTIIMNYIQRRCRCRRPHIFAVCRGAHTFNAHHVVCATMMMILHVHTHRNMYAHMRRCHRCHCHQFMMGEREHRINTLNMHTTAQTLSLRLIRLNTLIHMK